MFKSLRLALALLLCALALPLLTAGSASAAAKPGCVVSLSPAATETLFAIGAGPQVQAVDKDSNYPTTGLPSKRINAYAMSRSVWPGTCAWRGPVRRPLFKESMSPLNSCAKPRWPWIWRRADTISDCLPSSS